MAEPPLWDDTYTGARWTYGLSYRPLSSSSVPSGWILKSDRPHARFRFGTVDYPRQLRARDVATFELAFVTVVPALK